jgi:predicted peptidase
MDLLLYPPEQRMAWSLVLFLHGSGERGDNLELGKSAVDPSASPAASGFPSACVSPPCPWENWWDATQLTALLDEIVRTHKIDEDRVYATPSSGQVGHASH